LVNLTGLEPDSLKKFFFASFGANPLVVFGYNGGHYRLNPLKKSFFKVLTVFTSGKGSENKDFSRSHTQVFQAENLRV
jgi:hypothetical protein